MTDDESQPEAPPSGTGPHGEPDRTSDAIENQRRSILGGPTATPETEPTVQMPTVGAPPPGPVPVLPQLNPHPPQLNPHPPQLNPHPPATQPGVGPTAPPDPLHPTSAPGYSIAEAGPTTTGSAPYEVQLESVRQFDNVNARPYLRRLEEGAPDGPNWSAIIKVAAVLTMIVAGIFAVSQLRSPGGNDSNLAGPDGPIANPSVSELAQATVQIIGLDRSGQPLCSGSGTFVSVDGMVLTNAHVVTRDAVCDFSSLGIAVTVDSGRPPELLYRGDLLAIDQETDLAVLRIAAPIDPEQQLPAGFPALVIGNSDGLTIGDDVRILGYPEIGGETITFTNGSVSGFTAQAGIGDRALIKTDATIAGGNSGGAAVDAEGRLVGIPTKARASESGPAVDCRPLADTNGDGEVDDADNCVPIGGFLNGIRPINLAVPLIEQARQATPQPLEEAGPEVFVDPSQVTMSRPRFSIGESQNLPSEIVVTAVGGIPELCLFVDWAGIPNGVEWDGIWYYNQEPIDEYSLVSQSWEFGDVGSNFWMCAIDDQAGLASGLYELAFFLSGELVFAEGIVLADEPPAVFPTTWENQTDVDVCGLAVNPQGSGQVGLSELPVGTVLPPGETITIDLPAGPAVVEAYDCDGIPVADSAADGIVIEPDLIYTIRIPGTDEGTEAETDAEGSN